MVSIFEVTDYRDLLKAYYDERKAQLPLFSYQMMGARLGLDGGRLFHIMQKTRHLPVSSAPAAKEMLGLTGRASQYFDLLFAASRTHNLQKKEELLNKAYALRDVQRRMLYHRELRYFSHWWIAVVRSFLEVNGGIADPESIARCLIPPVGAGQVREALDILKEIGLVRRMASGRLAVTDAHLTAGGADKARAVRDYQSQILYLGAQALDAVPVQERDISTLTVSVDEKCAEDIKMMLQEFRRQVQKRIEESVRPDRVMQLTMAFFPVAKKARGTHE